MISYKSTTLETEPIVWKKRETRVRGLFYVREGGSQWRMGMQCRLSIAGL
jgi:hypothetical protein